MLRRPIIKLQFILMGFGFIMDGFFRCFVYLTSLGMLAFFAGRIIPKSWINPDIFPYKTFQFENDGRIYELFGVREWQSKVLDMSKILPKFIPQKKLDNKLQDTLPLMIKETCIAELIHWILFVPVFYCLTLWEGMGGVIIVTLYELFNIPYIMIQRYNRPRLINTLNRMEKRNNSAMHAAA